MKINEIAPGEKLDLDPSTSDYTTDLQHYFELIKRDCNNALLAMQQAKGFLFRGIKDNNVPQAFHGKSRVNRKNTDVPDFIQQAFDDKFREHSFTALRSKSIYCTGDSYNAKKYGTTYVIFPINGFGMTWSPKIDDLYYRLGRIFGKSNCRSVTFDDVEEKLNDELFNALGFTNQDLAAAIISKNEILISGEYYAFRYSPELHFAILPNSFVN